MTILDDVAYGPDEAETKFLAAHLHTINSVRPSWATGSPDLDPDRQGEGGGGVRWERALVDSPELAVDLLRYDDIDDGRATPGRPQVVVWLGESQRVEFETVEQFREVVATLAGAVTAAEGLL